MRNVGPITSDEEPSAAQFTAIEAGKVDRDSSRRNGGAG
jgi:hypothetical protein